MLDVVLELIASSLLVDVARKGNGYQISWSRSGGDQTVLQEPYLNSGKKEEHKDQFFGPGDCRVGWGSSMRRGGGRKVNSLNRKFVFQLGFGGGKLGCSGKFAGMSQTLGGVQKACARKVCAHFLTPINTTLRSA